MLDTIRFRLSLILALALVSAVIATAGDFWISIQNSSTIKDESARNAIVLVRADGCHNPADANITATAEGLVNGVRRSIPLKLEPVSQPATFAVTRQWPAEGVWVLKVNAAYRGLERGAIVRLGKQSSELFHRKVTSEDVDSALKL